MNEPTNLMRKSAASLFPDDPEEQGRFLSALLDPVPTGNALIWLSQGEDGELQTIPRSQLPGWLPESVELLQAGEKPGKTPAFQRGHCYSLDFSSVLTGSALLSLSSEETLHWRILDLCAAPGGKSILASAWLNPELLLANEVEGKRLGILRHNLSRCRIESAFTQRLAPEVWREQASDGFDLCLVDAPCSGQSLLAKGTENLGCFHPSIVKGNARRQLRILTDAATTVRRGGYLFYSTCTFDVRENEGVIRKFLSRQEGFTAVPVPHLIDYRSPHADFPAYRIYPHCTPAAGVYPHCTPAAGGFVTLLQRESDGSDIRKPIPENFFTYPVSFGADSGDKGIGTSS